MTYAINFLQIHPVFLRQICNGACDVGDIIYVLSIWLATTFSSRIPGSELFIHTRCAGAVQIGNNETALIRRFVQLCANDGVKLVGVAHTSMQRHDKRAPSGCGGIGGNMNKDITPTKRILDQMRWRFRHNCLFGCGTVLAQFPPFLQSSVLRRRGKGGYDQR